MTSRDGVPLTRQQLRVIFEFVREASHSVPDRPVKELDERSRLIACAVALLAYIEYLDPEVPY